jgi:hypothetical protein
MIHRHFKIYTERLPSLKNEQYWCLAVRNIKLDTCDIRGRLSSYTHKTKSKAFHLLYEASRHEDVQGSGGTVPRILNLDTTWR